MVGIYELLSGASCARRAAAGSHRTGDVPPAERTLEVTGLLDQLPSADPIGPGTTARPALPSPPLRLAFSGLVSGNLRAVGSRAAQTTTGKDVGWLAL